ncbi:MAG TPA: HipA N-terminal domain-containing protein [Mycobacterium sp.]|nr:HipA N-terminal domain-containing protein [Mycobacterium sp.]HTX97601.1 HipA N-terminal domain-containing protein [Mycobacterium sp.]
MCISTTNSPVTWFGNPRTRSASTTSPNCARLKPGSANDRCRCRCCAPGEYPVVTTGGSVPPFFAGPLPEGVRLGVVTSSTKTSADDHLTLLLAIGSDTIGNVRVVPSGMEPGRPLPMFEPE